MSRVCARSMPGNRRGFARRRLRVMVPRIGSTFLSLDFIYVPTADVDSTAAHYVDVLGAHLRWKVRGMGTVVACVELVDPGPAILLSGHLEGEVPVLVYRVADYAAEVARLRSAGLDDITELEIPHGPCASFRAVGGQRFAIYELVRPEAVTHFDGHLDD